MHERRGRMILSHGSAAVTSSDPRFSCVIRTHHLLSHYLLPTEIAVVGAAAAPTAGSGPAQADMNRSARGAGCLPVRGPARRRGSTGILRELPLIGIGERRAGRATTVIPA